MDGSASDFYGNDGVENANGSLEWLEVTILVGENTKASVVHPKADTSMNVLL